MSIIAIIAGEEKKGKTTFALSFPKPMAYYEFDLGGFARAKVRIKPEELAQITVRQYAVHDLNSEFKMKSSLETLLVTGMRERWQKFTKDFNDDCMNPDIRTLVLDTWMQVYELDRQAYLQTLQEAQLDETGKLKKGEFKLREGLQSIEYTQPYAKLRNLMFYARGMNKNLVLVTYDADEYKAQVSDDGKIRDVKTGKKIPAGWKETEKHADIALWCSIEAKQPVATITLPGLAPLELVGEKITDNSYLVLKQSLSMVGVEIE